MNSEADVPYRRPGGSGGAARTEWSPAPPGAQPGHGLRKLAYQLNGKWTKPPKTAGNAAVGGGSDSILHQYDAILTATRYLIDGKMASVMVGESMAKGTKHSSEDVAALTVRVPRALVSDIDDERKARTVRVPRNTWILEAVVEKLRREKLHNGPGRGADDGQK